MHITTLIVTSKACWERLKSVAACILNSIIQGLNAWAHLPRYILVIPDTDIIDYVKRCEYLNKDEQCHFESIITWLVKEIKKAVEIRLDDLHRKRPGAILTSAEPRIIWVKVVPRPVVLAGKENFSLIQRFNTHAQNSL